MWSPVLNRTFRYHLIPSSESTNSKSLGAVHILRQPIFEVFRPPLPPSSVIVSNCLTSITAFKENTLFDLK